MNNIYVTCERLIRNGRTGGMQRRIDQLKNSGRLSEEEYEELNEMLNPPENNKTEEV